MRSESGTGKGLSRTDWTIAKIAVLAPMQIASVSIAVAAYVRSFHSNFTPNCMSRIMSRASALNGGKGTEKPASLEEILYCRLTIPTRFYKDEIRNRTCVGDDDYAPFVPRFPVGSFDGREVALEVFRTCTSRSCALSK